ncbi:MAG TPA: LppX_LprAFG lipoprotein [Micromonosporaceae bacterium]|nr:LppX_LprAFG lipoprotein [Micromonosporaceae bacterium]
MSRTRPLVALLGVLLLGLLGCTKKNDSGGDLPAADGLLKAAAEDMRTVTTVRFVIEASGTVAGLALRRAEGVLTREGDAQGKAQVEQFGTNIELEFIVKGSSMYIKGPTGGFQQVPLGLASTVYDPSAILDPDKGVANLLATATEGRTEAREAINGVDAYRVSAKLNTRAVSSLVPGVSGDITGQLWIGVDRPRLLKTTFAVPGQSGTAAGTVTITLSDFDAPVTINAP